mmetsp:Transcript_46742/g.123057  ORF Transcript_46742/g.123057 Transcript_46742/m.123057 type:complete len:337 (-) Transcript_46742:2226-3236(-)
MMVLTRCDRVRSEVLSAVEILPELFVVQSEHVAQVPVADRAKGLGEEVAVGILRLPARLEHERHEPVAADVPIDLDAAEDGQLARIVPDGRRLLELAHEELAHDAVHLVRNERGRVGRVLDAVEPALELLLDVRKLRVRALRLFLGDGLRERRLGLVALQRLVRSDGRAARRRDALLGRALQLADRAVALDAHVRRKEHKHLTGAREIVRHVVRVRSEAGDARERDASQPAQRKVLAVARRENVVDLALLRVHLVRAHARRKEGVLRRITHLLERVPDQMINAPAAEVAGEVDVRGGLRSLLCEADLRLQAPLRLEVVEPRKVESGLRHVLPNRDR